MSAPQVFQDGDRVTVTMVGTYRRPTPGSDPFVVITDGSTIDPSRGAVNVEPLDSPATGITDPHSGACIRTGQFGAGLCNSCRGGRS